MKKKKRYFVISDYSVDGTHFNGKWSRVDAIQFAKEIAKQGHNTKVYEAEFIKGFDAEIKVIYDENDNWS